MPSGALSARRGMDKMLVDSMGDVVITNDGVTILKEIDVEHPAAKMLVEVAKTQDEETGDGTTTAVILTGELLKKAVDLIDANVHPTIITAGYRLASIKALEVLEKVAMKIDINDRELLRDIAMTSMMSKSVSGSREHMADVAVDAVVKVAEKADGKWIVDTDNIQVVKKQGGSMKDTEMIEGIIVDKEPVHPAMPEESCKCQDNAARCRARDKEDRDRCQDRDHRTVADAGFPPRGRAHAA